MAALARYVLTADVTITWPATWSEIIQGAANTPVAAPAVPATTVAADNAAGVPVTVAVTGATVTAVTVNGTQALAAAGTVIVPYPGTISLTYPSGTPTWTWTAAELPQSGSSSMTAAVSGTAPPAGQAGTLPQTVFLQGTPLWLDSGGQLYAAIGGGNLRAWIDGTDNVGHGHWGALSN
jgi:hypothetical protein